MSYLGRKPIWQLATALSFIAMVSTGCHYFPRDTTVPPARHCPPPNINTTSWRVITASDCGIRLRLPRRYTEDGYRAMPNGSVHRTFRADFFNSINIDFEETPNATLAEKKTIRQNDYEGFAECNESIGGSVAILQSYRGGGSVTDGSREF